MERKKYAAMSKVAVIVISILTFLSFWKAIWISLDIDESYSVAMSYRLAVGDRFVRDLWEPHQFSAFLAAVFTVPYIGIRGNTDYIVIYLRIIGILVHVGSGLVLYKCLSRTLDRMAAFGILALHLNYLPKWVQMPEFELMHYWCLLWIFIFLYRYFIGGKGRLLLPFSGGAFLAFSLMCYPTMVVLYPFYVLGIYKLERQHYGRHGWKSWRSCAVFTLGAFLTGAGFLAYLFSYMSLNEFKRYIAYFFLDTSHGIYTVREKWAMYAGQFREQGRDCGVYLLIAAGIVLGSCLIHRLAFHKASGLGVKKQPVAAYVEPGMIMIFLTAGLLMQLYTIYAYLFQDKNQFFFQARYFAVLVPAVILGIRYHRKMAIWLYLCVLPGLMSIPAVLLVTNMDTNVTYAKSFLAVLGSFLILCHYIRDCLKEGIWEKGISIMQYVLGGSTLAGLLVCRLLLIRVTGCLPITVRAPLVKMQSGPEAGIYVLSEVAEVWNENYRELEKYISKEDRLLYVGAESLVYVGTEALLSTPSTQGTAVFNEMYLYYYVEHPERIPDVIVFDKTFVDNPVYSIYCSLSLQSGVLFEWIAENYGENWVVETDHMIILRKN